MYEAVCNLCDGPGNPECPLCNGSGIATMDEQEELDVFIQKEMKSHAHFCADCGNDVLCERVRCPGITPGEQSKECINCYQKRCELGFDESEIGG